MHWYTNYKTSVISVLISNSREKHPNEWVNRTKRFIWNLESISANQSADNSTYMFQPQATSWKSDSIINTNNLYDQFNFIIEIWFESLFHFIDQRLNWFTWVDFLKENSKCHTRVSISCSKILTRWLQRKSKIRLLPGMSYLMIETFGTVFMKKKILDFEITEIVEWLQIKL